MKRIKTLVNLFYTNFWFRWITVFMGLMLFCIVATIVVILFILLLYEIYSICKFIPLRVWGIIFSLAIFIGMSYMISVDIGDKNE